MRDAKKRQCNAFFPTPIPSNNAPTMTEKLDKWNDNEREATKVGNLILNSNMQALRLAMVYHGNHAAPAQALQRMRVEINYCRNC